jgi:membrane-bound serine protease (ClpP class)
MDMRVTRQFGFVIAALWLLSLAAGAWAQPAAPSNPTAIIRLSGEVNDYTRDTLFRHFREAEATGAKTVILELDTYGGLVTSGLDISRFLRGQSSIHTIALVDNKAISAGSLIALACDEVVMVPGSQMGDCAPIVLGRDGRMEPLPATERAKIQSPILSDFEDSAARNGYNPLLVDAMVKVETTVYLVQDASHHERAVDEATYKSLIASGEWKPAEGVSNPIDGPETLLTVGPVLAKRLGLSKGTVSSAQELAGQRGLSIIADLRPGFGDHLVEALNGNFARFLLLVVFLLSLYIALHAPGHGAAEAFAIVSLGLLVCVPLLTGFAQWWEVAMIVMGLALCAFELLVFPGHGVSLGVGVLMVLLGLLFTFAGKEPNPGWMPESHETWHRLAGGLKVMTGAMIAAVVGAIILRPFLPKLPLFRKLILTETSGGAIPAAGALLKASDDVWPFVGTVGIATTDLKPGGIVQFPYGADTRNAPVVCTGGYIPAGTRVFVQEARGNRIVVKPHDAKKESTHA